jgi:hypothetical protein
MMDDDARGAPGFGESRGATASAPSRRPLALAALVGLAVAAVPSLGAHLLSEQAIREAGEHARPLIALALAAPLAAVMVVAAAADWLRGRGSPLAAVRQLGALALVLACFFVAVQGDLVMVGGGFFLIGGAVGLGIAFALGRGADGSGPGLAMVGWAGYAIPLVLQVFVAWATSPPDPTPSHFSIGPRAALGMACGFAFVAAFAIGVTAVPLGGRLGEWLRGQAE